MKRLICFGNYVITGNRFEGWWVHRAGEAPTTGVFAYTLGIAEEIAQDRADDEARVS